MATITAIITAYRRPQNIGPLVAAIRAQSAPPAKIWAWANEPLPEISAALAAAKLHRVVTSSENALFHGRFALALLADTEYVAIFDDDSIPGVNWFANCLATMRHAPGILGTAGVRLAQPSYRDRTMHGWQRPCDAVIEVDLACQAWFLRTEWVRHLFAAPAVLGVNGEDIELAARAWRLAGIRSFCAPHPASDRSRWGSTRGLELGIDEVAASLRGDHLDQRERIVKAEIDAGWQPLCLRNRPPAQPWTTNFAYPDATSGNATGASPAVTLQALECTCEAEASNALRPVQVELPPETFERIELGALLEKLRDPLGLLREAHRRLSAEGVLSVSFTNLRHESVIERLLSGHWQRHRGMEDECNAPADKLALRFFTRREIEKLLDRAGFKLSSIGRGA